MEKKAIRLAAAPFSCFLLLALCPQVYAEATMQTKDASSFLTHLFRFQWVTSVAASADNSKVAYSAFSLKTVGSQKYWQNQLYLTSGNGKTIVLAEGADTISSPTWSSDGQKLAYLTRNRVEQKTDLWIFNVKQNVRYRLLTLKRDIISYRWSPNGRNIAFIAEDLEPHRSRKPAPLIDVSKNYVNMRLYWVGANKRLPPKITPLTSAEYSVHVGSHTADFDWSPDGKQIAFAYQPRPDFQDASLSKIALMDLATRKMTTLPYTEHFTGITPAFSPDGKWLAFATNLAPSTYNQEAFHEILHYRRICVANLANPARISFLPNTPSESPSIIGWDKDGKGVYVFDYYRTKGARLYFLGLDSSGGAKLISHFPGRINHLTLSLNSSRTTFGFAYETAQDAPEACVSPVDQDALKLQKVSRLQEPPKKPLGQVEAIHWNAPDGKEIEGLLTRPSNYDPRKKYPLYLLLHGAPHVWTERFLGVCDEYGQQLVEPTSCLSAVLRQGFIVFQPNFRGSMGYGKDFQGANVGDWGGKDYQDIMSGVDDLVQKGIVDETRMVVSGWSYGGYMTAFVIGQTDRFKAAIVGAGVTDLISMAGTSEIPELLKKNHGFYWWENFDYYWQRSPLSHVKKIHTPVLILTPAGDTRAPVSQSYELYQALRLQQKPVTMLLLPGEGHVLTDPNIILASIQAITDLLAQVRDSNPGNQAE